MRRPLMIAATALTLAGTAGTAALAQNAPPPAPTTDAPAPPPPRPHPGPHWMGMGGWHHHHDHGPGEHARFMPFAPGTFRLFARQPDKHLSTGGRADDRASDHAMERRA